MPAEITSYFPVGTLLRFHNKHVFQIVWGAELFLPQTVHKAPRFGKLWSEGHQRDITVTASTTKLILCLINRKGVLSSGRQGRDEKAETEDLPGDQPY